VVSAGPATGPLRDGRSGRSTNGYQESWRKGKLTSLSTCLFAYSVSFDSPTGERIRGGNLLTGIWAAEPHAIPPPHGLEEPRRKNPSQAVDQSTIALTFASLPVLGLSEPVQIAVEPALI
jgi:hypothetical protein